jgi:transposase
MQEEMIPIKEYPDYSITRDGKIYRMTFRNRNSYKETEPRLLKNKLDKAHGYVLVQLCKNGEIHTEFLHKLLLETFIGKCPEGKESSHINGIRSDNRIENLCWETRKENHARKHQHGTAQFGEKNPFVKLSEADVKEIWEMLSNGKKQRDIANKFNVHESTISAIKHRKSWTYYNGNSEIERLRKENAELNNKTIDRISVIVVRQNDRWENLENFIKSNWFLEAKTIYNKMHELEEKGGEVPDFAASSGKSPDSHITPQKKGTPKPKEKGDGGG